MMIEACAAWPVGRWVLYESAEQKVLAHAKESLTRATLPPNAFPRNFDPVGTIERGNLVALDACMAERMTGACFNRMLLDVVRAAFPGVRWNVATVEPYPAIAYGCLYGRVVALVAEVISSEVSS